MFVETKLSGAYLIEPELQADESGYSASMFSQSEFTEHGLVARFVQSNISFNAHKGTLRGMHYQAEPYEEIKVVWCTMGAIYDVILDLRSTSPTYKQWFGVELTSANRKMLYIPAGFAHGFQTLEDDTEVFYMMGEFYHPESARGVRWDDPAFGIKWPSIDERIISEKDQSHPLWE